jgi:hypothetical protein
MQGGEGGGRELAAGCGRGDLARFAVAGMVVYSTEKRAVLWLGEECRV